MAPLARNSHGGNVHAASRHLHRPIDKVLDFSASINPLGPSPAVWRAIAGARHLLRHYPDPDSWNLRRTLAARWHCRPDRIVVGNGSSELIHLLPRALRSRHWLVVGPTFSEYAAAMERAGGRVSMLLAERGEEYIPPVDRVLRLVNSQARGGRNRNGFDAVVLCNPNSPTGQVAEAAAVLRIASAAARHGLWLIVDESFAEYHEAGSIVTRSAAHPRVIVLRSLTKFFSLPGLRVGYVMASPAVTQRLRDEQAPWSVNAMAQVASVAALNDRSHARRSLAFMNGERVHLSAGLTRLPGCTVFPSYVNFLFVELPPTWPAHEAVARLRRQGLLIRDCSTVPGSTTRSVRIAVKTRRENNRLMKALSALLSRK